MNFINKPFHDGLSPEILLLSTYSSPSPPSYQGGSEGELVNPECVVERVPATSQFELLLKVDNSGHYVGCVSYKVS